MSNITIHQDEPNITVSEPMRDYHLPIASETVLGGIKVGNKLSITEEGVLSADENEYVLPEASASTLGGIKVGSNLLINDGVLTADVDSVLSSSSSATNPVQNKVITSAMNALTGSINELDNRLDTLEDNYSTLSDTVSSNSDNISDLQGDLSTLDDTVSTNTNNISTNTTAIETNAGAITALAGLLGFLFMNLEGNFLLGANSSTTIYTFQTPSNIPLYTTSATVLTDVGNIVLEVTDQGEVNLSNPSASALTISKIYGNVPLVY